MKKRLQSHTFCLPPLSFWAPEKEQIKRWNLELLHFPASLCSCLLLVVPEDLAWVTPLPLSPLPWRRPNILLNIWATEAGKMPPAFRTQARTCWGVFWGILGFSLTLQKGTINATASGTQHPSSEPLFHRPTKE